ncbi:MAG: NACHT domain-containing protein [bacterium]
MQAWHGVRGPAADLAATVTEMPFHGAGRIAYVQQDYVPITIEFEDAPNLPSDGLTDFDEHFVPSSPVRWLITGGAGSGKTTLCRYLIVRWSMLHGHDDVEWGDVRYVPWLLNLDAFAGEGQGVDPFKWAVREYSRTFGDHDADTLLRLEEGLRALARAGLLVLVFDGYDELKPDHSQLFHALIEGLKRRWKALSIVVLSRPLGASDRFVAGEWRRASLRPLDAAAQRDLLERSGRAKDDAEKLLNRLTESMDASERRIMHNPLLLTLAAQIEGRIVESRWRTEFEILDAIIELSLATALRGSTQTEREAFRQVLMCVALVLARRDEFFSREALVEIIEAHLDRVRSVIVATARSAKGFLGHCKSCGLLKRSERSDSWRFSHHAIRDHLAVLALLDDPEKLMDWFAETTGPRAASGRVHEGDLRALPRALAMAIRRMGAGGLRALAQDHLAGEASSRS